jgi:hypothetical protein
MRSQSACQAKAPASTQATTTFSEKTLPFALKLVRSVHITLRSTPPGFIPALGQGHPCAGATVATSCCITGSGLGANREADRAVGVPLKGEC